MYTIILNIDHETTVCPNTTTVCPNTTIHDFGGKRKLLTDALIYQHLACCVMAVTQYRETRCYVMAVTQYRETRCYVMAVTQYMETRFFLVYIFKARHLIVCFYIN